MRPFQASSYPAIVNSYVPGTGSKAMPLWQALDAFQARMREAGIAPPDQILADGRLHRFHIQGHRPGTKNGAYVFHPDQHPAGWFMDHKSGVSGTWKAGGGRWHMDEATRRQIEEDRRKRQAETEARYLKRAVEARALWDRAVRCAVHAYLARKGVQSHGLRVADWPKWIKVSDGWRRIVIPGALLVPLLDEAGIVWNVQAIFSEVRSELDRDKDFVGGRIAGLFFAIGEATETLRICEGYATGATLYEATGDRVYVAFTRTNLKAVALVVRKLFPKQRIVVCADNDRFTHGNPGVTDARAAALAVGGFVSVPEFPEGSTGTDWNDWHQHCRSARFTENLELNIPPLALRAKGGLNHG